MFVSFIAGDKRGYHPLVPLLFDPRATKLELFPIPPRRSRAGVAFRLIAILFIAQALFPSSSSLQPYGLILTFIAAVALQVIVRRPRVMMPRASQGIFQAAPLPILLDYLVFLLMGAWLMWRVAVDVPGMVGISAAAVGVLFVLLAALPFLNYLSLRRRGYVVQTS